MARPERISQTGALLSEEGGEPGRILECMRSHCAEIPFSGISLAEGFPLEDSSPESCYLRGMEAVVHHDWEALEEEIRRTEQQKDQKHAAEIWLNLSLQTRCFPWRTG